MSEIIDNAFVNLLAFCLETKRVLNKTNKIKNNKIFYSFCFGNYLRSKLHFLWKLQSTYLVKKYLYRRDLFFIFKKNLFLIGFPIFF